MAQRFKFLFSPLKIGKVVVPNRISFSAHLTNFAVNSLPTEREAYYYAERAKGGCGLIIHGEQSVHPTDHAYEKLIDAFDERVIPGYKKITSIVHQYDTIIFAQLNHNGQQCDGTLSRLPVWAPSPIPDILFREMPKEMEIEDIHEVLEGFYKSAINVREGGYDGIEIQASHSSIFRQFLSPLTNRRSDEYGGDLDNRLRFTYEVIESIRRAVGNDYTLGIRLSGDEMIPGGLTLDDTKEVAKKLEAHGMVDYINLSIATFYNLYLVEGSMHTPLGFAVHLAAGVKEVTKLPVFACGRINDPIFAEKVLADGHADMIGIVRGQICDPEFANKAREGRLEDIRQCVADNQGCIGRMGVNKTLSCVQNPAVGNEKEMGVDSYKPTSKVKRVMVIGGGPAGMETARVAALRGHDVTLYEKGEELGGQINIAKKGAGRAEIEGVIRHLILQLKKLKVKVKLNTEVTEELVKKENPDAVVIATGSYPITKPVGGEYSSPQVVNSWQVLNGEVELGNKIIVIDGEGHHKATGTAEYLADLGKDVTVVASSPFVGCELGPLQDMFLTLQRLMQKKVKMIHNIAVMEIQGTTVIGFNVYSMEPFKMEGADNVVTIMGNKADDALYFSLKDKVKELHRIGDCMAPRRMDMAILEGNKVGRIL